MKSLLRWYELAMDRVFDHLGSPLLFALRLYVGWQFFTGGKEKLETLDRFTLFLEHLGIAAPQLNAPFVASLECIGGLLLMVGLASRLIAIPLSIDMIVAYLTADHEAVMNAFKEPDMFIAATPFIFLLVSLLVLAFGPGYFSIDHWIGALRKKRRLLAAAVAPQIA
jgi:putative oxidoreductase